MTDLPPATWVPVGKIVPWDVPVPALTIARPARRKGGWAALAVERKAAEQRSAAIIDDTGEDRV